MDVEEYNYEDLARDAKGEVEQMDIDASTKQTMSRVIDAYVSLQEERQNYTYTGFSLELNGIDSDLYHKFQRVAGKLRRPMGSIITKLMQDSLSTGEIGVSSEFFKQFVRSRGMVVQHYRTLEIGANDLKEIDLVTFQHIKHLVLKDDISEDLFSEKIGMIQHCKSVQLPSSFSKLVVLAKTQHCRRYTFSTEHQQITA